MKLKTITGILLIILSIAGVIYWESCGRERFTTVEVLAAAVPIKEGTTVQSSDLKPVKLPAMSKPSGSLSFAEASSLQGMTAKVSISADQPVERSMFAVCDEVLKNGSSVFVLPGEWIFSRPAMLRAGDRVALYAMPEKEKLGVYEIAYVRDSAEQAVLGDEAEGSDILSRDTSSGVISSVEIICRPQEYFAVYDRAMGIAAEDPEAIEEPGGGQPEDRPEEYSEDEDEEPEPFLVLVPEEKP